MRVCVKNLLVLTHVSLLEGIDFSTFPEQDELLLLDADPNLAHSHTLQGLGKRVHFVNISAADAARRYYRQCSEWADLNDEDIFRNVCTIRWYKGISYQDSVDIAIQEMFDAGVAEGRIDTMTVVETEEDLKVGDMVTVSIDIDAHEYNGRWYNQIRAWNVVNHASAQQPSAQQAPPPTPQSGALFPQQSAPGAQPAPTAGTDQLPF